MMLADMGAEVIRIEPPWGSVDRLADGALFGGASYTFHHFNLNKLGLTLNLKTSEGLRIFKDLVPLADVVVQNFRPGTMERLGLDYGTLKNLKEDIIYAALSGFGQTGPYSKRPCFAPIAEAMSSHSKLTGEELDHEGPPIEMAQAYGDLGPGLFAAMSIIAAIRHRDRTGQGQMIDVAQLDCMVSLVPAITGYNLSGMLLWQLKEKFPLGKGFGGLFKTGDGGWVRIASFSPRIIDKLADHLNVKEVSNELLAEKIATLSRDEAVQYFVEAEVPVAPIYNVNDVSDDPHLHARKMFVEVYHPDAGNIRVPNFPVKFSETPGIVNTAAPTISQNNKDILKRLLNYDDEKINFLRNINAI
jgi:CoA:oxalate CoA-transferase